MQRLASAFEWWLQPALAWSQETVFDSVGGLADLAVSDDDEVLVVLSPAGNQLEGATGVSRLERFDLQLRRIDTWTPPRGVELTTIALNAAAHVAIAGSTSSGTAAWMHSLELRDYRPRWTAPLVTPSLAGSVLAIELLSDDQLIVLGEDADFTNGKNWLQIYDAIGNAKWPHALTHAYMGNGAGGPAVHRQPSGVILTNTEQVMQGYCE